MFSPDPVRTNILADRDFPVAIDMKDGFLGLLVHFHQIILKLFYRSGKRNITSIISADNSLALQVRDEDSRRNHGRSVFFVG
jgi:hypothetical protein